MMSALSCALVNGVCSRSSLVVRRFRLDLSFSCYCWRVLSRDLFRCDLTLGVLVDRGRSFLRSAKSCSSGELNNKSPNFTTPLFNYLRQHCSADRRSRFHSTWARSIVKFRSYMRMNHFYNFQFALGRNGTCIWNQSLICRIPWEASWSYSIIPFWKKLGAVRLDGKAHRYSSTRITWRCISHVWDEFYPFRSRVS